MKTLVLNQDIITALRTAKKLRESDMLNPETVDVLMHIIVQAMAGDDVIMKAFKE